MQMLDTVVIGAGPAGTGTAIALNSLEGIQAPILEMGKVGNTFLKWQPSQRFLTPSFTGNGYDAIDLNAIHPLTSPAYTLGVDYPHGEDYAQYLRALIAHFEVPIAQETTVTSVVPTADGFEIETNNGLARAHSVVWAAGEFHDPFLPELSGAEYLQHSSAPEAWSERQSAVVVIGGYESGIEIAEHHLRNGAEVTVIDPCAPWDPDNTPDPSFTLAPRTRMSLRKAAANSRLRLVKDSAEHVELTDGGYLVYVASGARYFSGSAPLAATGFGPGLGAVSHLFEPREDGWPLLTADDESTVTPGLFLVGPAVRHDAQKFCFVYKYRQRFAHVAAIIGGRLGFDCTPLDLWSEHNMVIDDVSCCVTECAC